MEKNKKTSIVALALITAVCLIGDSMLYIVLPIHWKEAGLSSLIEVGILLSINRFVRLPLNPLIGFIYTRINLRNGILLAVLLAGITTVGYGLVNNFSLWLILRSVWGIAWSLFKLGAFLLILQLTSDSNRGHFVGTYNGLYRIGSLVGMLVGGVLADIYGIKIISILVGLLSFMSIPFIYKFIPKAIEREENKHQRISIRHYLHIFSNAKLIWIVVTAFFSIMILDGMLNATLSHIININFNNEYNMFGIVLGAASLAGLLQAIRWGIFPFISPLLGGVLDRTNRKGYMLSFFLVIASIALLIIPLQVPFIIWVPILLVHLLVTSSVTTILDTIVTEIATLEKNKVLIMTVYTVVVDLGAAFGPILGYTLEGKIGLTNLFWLGSVICFLLTLKWLIPEKGITKEIKIETSSQN
ncbi:MFS transporter [Bacillus alkalisoli]|uniref:MFS transporter n=1 Tax=Bacillus alkalisoli TaxID=2011008 RepID=UPI000C23AA92|nr:MFS transporter [Bacillus alkalisoli]